MTDNEPNAAKNTLAAKRVRTLAKSLGERFTEMQRNILARVIRLVIAAVIATTCLGAASAVVTHSVPVAGVTHPTPWP
jgi:hypothetical protein